MLFSVIKKLIKLGYQYDYMDILQQTTFIYILEYIKRDFINPNHIKPYTEKVIKSISLCDATIIISTDYVLFPNGTYRNKRYYTAVLVSDSEFSIIDNYINSQNEAYFDVINILYNAKKYNLKSVDRIEKLEDKTIMVDGSKVSTDEKIYLINIQI